MRTHGCREKWRECAYHRGNDTRIYLLESSKHVNGVVLDYGVNALRLALNERQYVMLEPIVYSREVAEAISRLQMILKEREVNLMTNLIVGRGNVHKLYELWLVREQRRAA